MKIYALRRECIFQLFIHLFRILKNGTFPYIYFYGKKINFESYDYNLSVPVFIHYSRHIESTILNFENLSTDYS